MEYLTENKQEADGGDFYLRSAFRTAQPFLRFGMERLLKLSDLEDYMKSLEELRAIRERMQSQVSMRAEDHTHIRVVVGMATCGIASGARPVLTALSNLVQEKGLTDRVSVTQTGCIGLCQYEPIVEVMEPGKDKVTYIKMNRTKPLKWWNAI